MVGDYLSNLSRNTGGLGGGLMALGQSLSAASAAIGQTPMTGSKAGNAASAFAATIGPAMKNAKKAKTEQGFLKKARENAGAAPAGSREKQFWETVASGDPNARALLPGLWNAQNYDRKESSADGPTAAQFSRNRKIDEARISLGKIRNAPDAMTAILAQGNFEGWNSLVSFASSRKVAEPDPDYHYYAQASVLSPIAGLMGEGALSPQAAIPADVSTSAPGEASSPGILGGIADAASSFFGVGADHPAAPEEDLSAALTRATGVTAAPPESVPPVTSHQSQPAPAAPISRPGSGNGDVTRPRDPGRRAAMIQESARAHQANAAASLLRAAGLVPAEATQAALRAGTGPEPSQSPIDAARAMNDRYRPYFGAREFLSQTPGAAHYRQASDYIGGLIDSIPPIPSGEFSIPDGYLAGKKARRTVSRGLFGR